MRTIHCDRCENKIDEEFRSNPATLSLNKGSNIVVGGSYRNSITYDLCDSCFDKIRNCILDFVELKNDISKTVN